MSIATFLTDNKDLLTIVLAIYAALVSTVNLLSPRLKEMREQRNAIFQALQGDRKALANVSLRVIDGDWDKRIKRDEKFRDKLLRSLAISVALEGSDRGKAYMLSAIRHIIGLHKDFKAETLSKFADVTTTFEEYARTGTEPDFKKDRIIPLQAIVAAIFSS